MTPFEVLVSATVLVALVAVAIPAWWLAQGWWQDRDQHADAGATGSAAQDGRAALPGEAVPTADAAARQRPGQPS